MKKTLVAVLGLMLWFPLAPAIGLDFNAVRIASLGLGQGNRSGLTILGETAYTANSEGLVIVDISDPRHPVMIGGYASGMRDFAVSGDYAYLASEDDGMVVVGGYGDRQDVLELV